MPHAMSLRACQAGDSHATWPLDLGSVGAFDLEQLDLGPQLVALLTGGVGGLMSAAMIMPHHSTSSDPSPAGQASAPTTAGADCMKSSSPDAYRRRCPLRTTYRHSSALGSNAHADSAYSALVAAAANSTRPAPWSEAERSRPPSRAHSRDTRMLDVARRQEAGIAEADGLGAGVGGRQLAYLHAILLDLPVHWKDDT